MEFGSDESKVVTNGIYVEISETVHNYNFIKHLKFPLKSNVHSIFHFNYLFEGQQTLSFTNL
jgi:hypothetical protein